MNTDVDYRPNVGILNINPFKIKDVLNNWDELMNTITHELIHILGFSPQLYQFYVDKNLNKIGKDNIATTKIVRGTSRLLIKTPKVLETAR